MVMRLDDGDGAETGWWWWWWCWDWVMVIMLRLDDGDETRWWWWCWDWMMVMRLDDGDGAETGWWWWCWDWVMVMLLQPFVVFLCALYKWGMQTLGQLWATEKATIIGCTLCFMLVNKRTKPVTLCGWLKDRFALLYIFSITLWICSVYSSSVVLTFFFFFLKCGFPT